MSNSNHNSRFYVVKRDGTHQAVSFDQITERLDYLCTQIEPTLSPDNCDTVYIAKKIIESIRPGITTREIDQLTAETCFYSATIHPEYAVLGARICISNLQKEAPKTFFEAMEREYKNRSPKTGLHAPLISKKFWKLCKKYKNQLNEMIQPNRDYLYEYFGWKTLEKGYLVRVGGNIVETPQYMLLRVALEIHKDDLELVKESYDLLSEHFFTHATPTLFNAGTPNPQMSSCFLLSMTEDSIDGIYDTLKRCALISKSAGGIGLSVTNIRGENSYIQGTNGWSDGLVPMLRVYNDTARYVDQGGGKRKGAFAIYLEPWHCDIEAFLDLKKNHGKEERRARDLFYALWTPNLFFERVKKGEKWSLFCPNEAKGLGDCYGKEFEELYTKYEQDPQLVRKTVDARELFLDIVKSMIETGTPYILNKDECNEKSNHKHLGTIKSSNLCTEIIQYTSPEEVAVCNLSSIALPKYIKDGVFDFERLARVVRVIVRNLNKVIDANYYPIPEAEYSNKKHRPIGIGVQGLADVFIKLRYPWNSVEARELNRDIFETIYFAALTESCVLAQKEGTYASYQGSPVSQGILQPDMWNVQTSDRWDWSNLRADIAKFGVRNSLLVAPMPTASTAQILGNNEGFEPYTSNVFVRRVLSGDFPVINKHLVEDLIKLDLWNKDIRDQIVAHDGSIQFIDEIPQNIKDLYKTVWEIHPSVLIDMAADRGAFIDQSQSFNLFIADPDYQSVTNVIMYAQFRKLKTISYYLRTRPAADAIKFTLNAGQVRDAVEKRRIAEENKQRQDDKPDVCTMKEGCWTCGS